MIQCNTGSNISSSCEKKCQATCPESWEKMNGTCFFWSTTPLSWTEGENILYICPKETVEAKQIDKVHYLVGRSKFWEGKINIFWQIDQQGFLFRLHCFDSFPTLSQCSLKIEGERNCSANGGHLASVTSQRTQDYLVARNSTVWIGGHLIYGVIFNLNPNSSISWALYFLNID